MRQVALARCRVAFFLVLAVVGALLSTPARPAAAAITTCTDFYLLGSRGSGQPTAAQDGVTAGLGAEVAQFRDSFVSQRPSGTTFGFEANPYGAVAVARGAENSPEGWFWNLIGAGTWLPIGRYHKSVAEGVSWLTDEVREVIRVCPTTRILLAGYSQGAQVTADAFQLLTDAETAHVFGVVLIADPRFNGSDNYANAGSYSPKNNGSVRTAGQIVETARPVFASSTNGKVLSFCHGGDPVCQAVWSFKNSGLLANPITSGRHTNYTTVGDACGTSTYPVRAASYFAYRAGNQKASDGPVAVLTPIEDAASGASVKISAASSCDAAGRPLSYRWDFDGAGTFAVNTGAVNQIKTSFSGNGSHTVAVRVTNDQGQSSTATTTVDIGSAGAYTAVPSAPTNVVSTPAVDGLSATLTWDDPTSGAPVEAYEIYSADDAPLDVVAPGDPHSVVIYDFDLPLSVKVVPVNRVGRGTESATVTMYATWPPTQPGSAASCAGLNSLFNTYGNQGGHWTGADSTGSVALPDGRTAWLFSDTFLGTVNADYSRPTSTPFIHNSIVVQNGTTLTTLTGGTASAPTSLVGAGTDANPGDLGWWVGDGMVNGSTLQVFYHHYKSGGSGVLNYVSLGAGIATFALPSLTLQSLVPLDTNPQIQWGNAVVDGRDGYTYIYGVESANNTSYLHIARAPNGSVLGAAGSPTAAWTFWTDNATNGVGGWSTNESDAVRVLTGVGNGFSVKYLNGKFVLVTIDSDIKFSPSVLAYFATSPAGPFVGQTWLYNAPESAGSQIVYDARLHTEQSCGGNNFVISYNVNTLNNADNYADARIYRPRFIVATLPGAPTISALPDAPENLRATVTANSAVSLSWTAPVGPNDTNLTYQVYQRNASVGQEHFTPLPSGRTTATTATVGIVDGGTYDYRVTARNSVGESPPSLMDSVDVEIPAPSAAPTSLAASSLPDGTIALSWQPVGGAGWISYRVFERDVTAGDTGFTPAVTVGQGAGVATATSLTAGHTYQFVVSAYNSGGDGPRSSPATATATVAPPTNLTAVPQGEDSVSLSWTAPAPNDWYWIYSHDDTADPAGTTPFTQSKYPVATGTTFTAGYLTGGHTYTFYVTAVSPSGGESAGSNRASAAVPLPQAPHLTAAASNDGSIDLSWAAPSPNYWYWIWYHDDTADPNGAAGYTQMVYPTTATTFTATGLYIGHRYSYYVTSISGGGATSVPSNHVAVTATLAAPTGLTATAGDGKILLKWKAPLPGLWYWLYTKAPGSSTYTQSIYPVANDTSLTVLPVTNGQTYSFYVTSIGTAGGESAHSNTVSATPRATPPNAPTNVVAAANNDGTITVDWNGTLSTDWYWVYYHDDTADPGDSTPFTHGPYPVGSGTSLVVGPLTNGHTYSFYVTTISSINGLESLPSDTVRAKSRLSPPSGLTAKANEDASVTLDWTASAASDVSYYWIYTKPQGASDFTRAKYPVHNRTSFVETGLKAGTTYQFYVTAVGDADNESAGSNVVSAVATLAPPTDVTATVDGYGMVTIRWTPPFAGALYQIYQHDDDADPGNDQPYTHLIYPAPSSSASAGVLVGSLTGDHTYSFYVTTAYAGNESKPSNRVAPNRRLAAPTGLRGSTIASSAGTGQCNSILGPDCHIHLAWNSVTGAAHYDVYRLMVSSDEASFRYIGSSSGTTFDMPVGALAQTRASYRVVAVRALNTASSAPSTPTTLTIGDYNGGSVTDCYVTASTPSISGSSVLSKGWSTCPRSTPTVQIIFTYSVVDNVGLTNTAQNNCYGPVLTCTSQATTSIRSGTHTYCTAAVMHVPTAVGGSSASGLVSQAISRCLQITG